MTTAERLTPSTTSSLGDRRIYQSETVSEFECKETTIKAVFYGGDGRRIRPAEYVSGEAAAKKIAKEIENGGGHVEGFRLRLQPFAPGNDKYFLRGGPMGRFYKTTKEEFVDWQHSARRK